MCRQTGCSAVQSGNETGCSAVQSGNEAELEDLRVHGSLQFISLKKLNRIAHFRSKKVRDATNDVSTLYYTVKLR